MGFDWTERKRLTLFLLICLSVIAFSVLIGTFFMRSSWKLAYTLPVIQANDLGQGVASPHSCLEKFWLFSLFYIRLSWNFAQTFAVISWSEWLGLTSVLVIRGNRPRQEFCHPYTGVRPPYGWFQLLLVQLAFCSRSRQVTPLNLYYKKPTIRWD